MAYIRQYILLFHCSIEYDKKLFISIKEYIYMLCNKIIYVLLFNIYIYEKRKFKNQILIKKTINKII